MARASVIAGNWKMYKNIQETQEFIKGLAPMVEGCSALVYLGVPFTAIRAAADAAKGTNIQVGGQNMNDAMEGAFTGEIAVSMLKEAGATFVILGHSERRHIFGETNEFINRKVKRALEEGVQPILCIGETLEEREAGKTEGVLKQQLLESLADVTAEQLASMIVAYEPVWAIGTGRTATPEMAQDAHKHCRQVLADKWGQDTADQVVIQYGGSVKPDNVVSLMEQSDIDGALVGGAALTVDSFSKLVNYK